MEDARVHLEVVAVQYVDCLVQPHSHPNPRQGNLNQQENAQRALQTSLFARGHRLANQASEPDERNLTLLQESHPSPFDPPNCQGDTRRKDITVAE